MSKTRLDFSIHIFATILGIASASGACCFGLNPSVTHWKYLLGQDQCAYQLRTTASMMMMMECVGLIVCWFAYTFLQFITRTAVAGKQTGWLAGWLVECWPRICWCSFIQYSSKFKMHMLCYGCVYTHRIYNVYTRIIPSSWANGMGMRMRMRINVEHTQTTPKTLFCTLCLSRARPPARSRFSSVLEHIRTTDKPKRYIKWKQL